MADAGQPPPTPPPPPPPGPSSERRSSATADDDAYVAPVVKSIGELMSSEGKEGEDEALQRYKANLLGAAAAGAAVSSDDPRRVVIVELAILINGREPLKFDMTQEVNLKGGLEVKLQEGAEYQTQLTFRVQNEIVSGLKYKNVVKRMAIPVLKQELMLGSYGPDPTKANTVVFPRREWEEAPSGMMARGKYAAKTTFVDDDSVTHLEFEYTLVIGKTW